MSMSKHGTETRRLPAQVLVRLTPQQQAAVKRHAEAAQVSMAMLVRRLIANAIEVDVGPSTSRAQPPEIILEIARLREVVAELGGSIVQAAMAARKDGRVVEHEKIEGLLPAIKSIVVELDAVKEKLWRPVR
jgi:hypothetical protein